ncbi:MAG: hypothetical protein ACRDRW_20650 [Pseudonocardiaceae bacterium]
MTTDPRLAEAQARLLLAEHHSERRAVPVECLTAHYRAATFAFGRPLERLFKRHADQAAYLGEVLAYHLLADDGVLPSLLSAHDDSRTLIVDYLAWPAHLRAPGVFDELIATVATVHTASARWDIQTNEAMAHWRVHNALATPTPNWITQPWLAREIDLPMTSREVRHTYRNRVNERGAHWSDTALVTALRAFADATGLHQLHDIAS